MAYTVAGLALMVDTRAFGHPAGMSHGSLPNASVRAALRNGRWSVAGRTYLVTVTTAARRRWFAHAYAAIAVARVLGGAELWRDNHARAWVLMPDHMHLLLTLGGRESIWQLMARVKAATGRAGRAVVASSMPFWADGFHDQVLREEEDVARSARRIITNPVRAGLVDTLWAWPFWDSEWLPEPGADPCDIPRPTAAALASLPPVARASRR